MLADHPDNTVRIYFDERTYFAFVNGVDLCLQPSPFNEVLKQVEILVHPYTVLLSVFNEDTGMPDQEDLDSIKDLPDNLNSKINSIYLEHLTRH